MKRTANILLIFALLALTCHAQDIDRLPSRGGHTGEIEKSYDRFTGETSYALNMMLVAGRRFNGLHVHAYTRVAPPSKTPDAILLGLTIVSPEDVRARRTTLHAIVDGDRGQLGDMKFIGSNAVGSVYAVGYSLMLKPDVLRRLAGAKKVEMRFDGVEFELKEDHRKALLDFLAYAHGR